MLKTKSIQKEISVEDGLRICVMRRPGDFTNWDLWIPKLSPSNELLNSYVYDGLPWNLMEKAYTSEVLEQQVRLIDWLIRISLNENVTLLCWEDDSDFCHRRLLAEHCRRLSNETLSIFLD